MGRAAKRRSVPDFIRRGIRQGLGVGVLVAVGYEIVEPMEERSKTAGQWLTCFKWAAISLIVLTAPVLGKVAQVSFERTIGTLAGGVLGLVTVLLGREMMQLDQAFTAIISGLVSFASVVAGHNLGLEYAGKLLAMTFILVVIGADGGVDAILVALTRCSGIILGVFLSMVLAVSVFPKSASHQATDNLADALQALCLLSSIAWNKPTSSDVDADHASGDIYLPLQSSSGTNFDAIAAVSEAECEKALMEVYNKLSKVDEFLPLAKRERYLFTFRGRWCFLPAVPWLKLRRWTIPSQPMLELATAIRRASRVLWALHVTFQQGFEEEVVSALRKRYPSELLNDLQCFSSKALEDMAAAFPDDTILPNTNVNKFLEAVKSMLKISDEQRRFIVRLLESQEQGGWGSPQLGAGAGASHGAKHAAALSISAFSAGENEALGPGGSASPRVLALKYDLFPQSSSGYISKIRWFSFQFLMQNLAEELENLSRSLAVVLKMLPNALEARHV